jgi:hypothetical protein
MTTAMTTPAGILGTASVEATLVISAFVQYRLYAFGFASCTTILHDINTCATVEQ